MVRKIAGIAVALSALQSNFVSALGLGELTLNSALNQPLQAEIKLLNAGNLDTSQVLINLASSDDFKRAGVERDFFLTNLNFKVELDDNGNGVIKISTKESVVEPYLDFILEARWPSGKLLREYTALLDLPIYSEAPAQRVSTAKQSSSQTSASSAPVKRTTERRVAPRQQSSISGDSYRVKSDDTLWEIANNFQPSQRVSVQQTMVAIQRVNPSAFIRGNINLLKAGAVLRLPDEAEVFDISSQQAAAEVATQNQQWRRGDGADSREMTAAQLDASGSSDQTSSSSSEKSGYLSIVSGSDAASSSAGGEGKQAGAGVQQLEAKLNASLESLDAANRENEELENRLADMEDQVETLKSMLNLKQDELAKFQSRLSETGDQPDAVDMAETDTTADEMVDDVASATGDVVADAEDIVDEAAEKTSEAATAAKDAAKEVAAKKPQMITTKQEPSFFANPLYWIIAGGAAVLGLLVFMLKRKSAEHDGTTEAPFDLSEITDDVDAPDEDDVDLDNALIGDDEVASEDTELESVIEDVEEIAEDLAEEAPQAVKPETGDAIAEADIYVAYGRYQQAVDLLEAAIIAEPTRTDLRTKLLDIHIETRDKEAFQHQFVELASLGDDAAISRVKELLSAVDGVSDWLDGMPATVASTGAAAAVATGAAVGLASDSDTSDETAAEAESASSLELEGDDGLDFDLELDAPETEAAETEELADLELDSSDASDELSLDDIDFEPEVEALADDDTSVESSLELDDLDLDLDLDSEDLDLNELNESEDDLTLPESLAELELPEEATEAPETVVETGEEILEDAGELDLLAEEEPVADAATEEVEADDFASVLEDIEDGTLDVTVDGLDDDGLAAELDAEDSAAELSADTLEEVATKLDLARAYIDMGDADGAKDILDEVVVEGSDEQKQEANELLARLDV